MDESLIIEIWDVFKEYVPEKNKETAANHFVDFLVGQDVELSILESVHGYDSHLDQAIQLVLDENADSDDDEHDYADDADEDR